MLEVLNRLSLERALLATELVPRDVKPSLVALPVRMMADDAVCNVEAQPTARATVSKRRGRDLCTVADLKQFCIRNFIVLGLATGIIVGLSWPWLGSTINAPVLGDYGKAVPTFLVIGM
jgi:hypothetical protein